MDRVRIAIIGAGMIGRRHLRVLLEQPGYVAAAIADPSPQAKGLAEEHGIPWFDDYERMLDEVRPDGAIVATPNQLHVAAGLACVARGVPVLVEKPIADSLPEALRLVAAGEAAGVPILVGHHRRHNPIMQEAARVLRDGGVGRITAVVAMWLSHKPDDYFDVAWRREPGGGTVLINGIHEIDGLRMLCGEIESVQAEIATGARGLPVEDTAAAVLRFANGALGTLDLGVDLARESVLSARVAERLSGHRHARRARDPLAGGVVARVGAALGRSADAKARSVHAG